MVNLAFVCRPNIGDLATLQDALVVEPYFDGYPLKRRKHMAELAIDFLLNAVDDGVIDGDDWQGQCIEGALQCLRFGAYDDTRLLARAAVRPPRDRGERRLPLPVRSPVEWRRDFEYLRAMPAVES